MPSIVVASVLRALGVGGLALVALSACQVRQLIGSNRAVDGDGGVTGGSGGGDNIGTGGTRGGSAGGGRTGSRGSVSAGSADTQADSSEPVWDVASPDAGVACGAPLPVVCAQDDDPWHAVGVNCGGFEATMTHTGDARSMVVHAGMLGTSGVYVPREGETALILSTGDAQDVPRTPEELLAMYPECTIDTCPSVDLGGEAQVPKLVLPEPLDHRRVDAVRDCDDDPTLIGTGDCSNTLQDEFTAGDGAFDYAEIRLVAQVPDNTNGLAFEFAFFTAEYPLFAGVLHEKSIFNDMYIAWLESEQWTGNISFDEMGNPVSINSVFLDYRDAPVEGCRRCQAPELAGFAAENHAGTDWLRTVAPVSPGETIELVIAVMDLTDGLFDSAVLLDGFSWTCTDLPPLTVPVG